MPPLKKLDRTIPTEIQNKPSIVRFLFLYLTIMGFFLVLIGYEPIQKLFDLNGFYTKLIVTLSAWLLAPFRIVENVTDTSITIRNIQMQVLFGCNGLEAFLIYTVGIIAFPAQIIQKFWGIFIGFFILQIINVLRIASLGLVGAYAPEFFPTFHIYIAQGMMIAVALMLFMFWLNWATRS
jgi:exosortase/archaeosortase family protein